MSTSLNFESFLLYPKKNGQINFTFDKGSGIYLFFTQLFLYRKQGRYMRLEKSVFSTKVAINGIEIITTLI